MRTRSSTVPNVQAGTTFLGRFRLALELLNALNERSSDIDYLYVSRLPGEPEEGVEDVHTHPFETRSVRASLSVKF